MYKVRDYPSSSTIGVARGTWREDCFEPGVEAEWGGTWATRDHRSLEILEEEIRPNDLVLAWQTDKSAAIGVCVVTRVVGAGEKLFLKPVELFPKPVKLHKLKKTTHPELQRVDALRPGPVGTLYPTGRGEARMLLEACGSAYSQVFE